MNTPKIIMESVEALNVASYNPRKIDEKELNKLIDSLNTFGFVDPVIVNKKNKTVIGGHQRLLAWQRMGKKELPCIYVDLPEDKEKALNVALNKISGEWDMNKLTELLTDINKTDLDVSLTGFDDDELSKMLGVTGDLDVIEGDNDAKGEEFDLDYIPQANIKMLQLYFSVDDYDLVTKMATKLMIGLNKQNITDVVKEALINECERKKISI